jgi:hypothetical protein
VTYSLAPEADAELTEAVAFCARQFSVSVAENFLATFELKVRLIAQFPGVGISTVTCRAFMKTPKHSRNTTASACGSVSQKIPRICFTSTKGLHEDFNNFWSGFAAGHLRANRDHVVSPHRHCAFEFA